MLYRAEKPSLATAMSVWKDSERIPVDDWISGGTLIPQYRPIRGPTVSQTRFIGLASNLRKNLKVTLKPCVIISFFISLTHDRILQVSRQRSIFESFHPLTLTFVYLCPLLLVLFSLSSIISITPSSPDICSSLHLASRHLPSLSLD